MKTHTIDIGDSTLQRARSLANSKGIKQLLADAVEESVRQASAKPQQTHPNRVWMKLAGAFGKTSGACAEIRRIQKIIDEEFERIEPEDRQCQF